MICADEVLNHKPTFYHDRNTCLCKSNHLCSSSCDSQTLPLSLYLSLSFSLSVTHTHMRTHTYTVCQERASTYWLPMRNSSLSSISSQCWFHSLRDVSNSRLWPSPLRRVYACVCVCMDSSLCACGSRTPVFGMRVCMCTDGIGCDLSITDLWQWHTASDERVSVSCRRER